MKVIREIMLFAMLCVAIPVDYILWNLFMSNSFGFRRLKNVIRDNIERYEELV